jgi:hypothetical protein
MTFLGSEMVYFQSSIPIGLPSKPSSAKRKTRSTVNKTTVVFSESETSTLDSTLKKTAGPFLAEDSVSNSSNSSSQSDSGIECCSSSGSLASTRESTGLTNSLATIPEGKQLSEGITLRSHRVLRDPKGSQSISPAVAMAADMGRGKDAAKKTSQNTAHEKSNPISNSCLLNGIRSSSTSNSSNSSSSGSSSISCYAETTFETESKLEDPKRARGPLRITFRMKRSAVLDEVIESGTNGFHEGALGDRRNCSDRESSDSMFQPQYEILRFEGSSPLHSGNNSYWSPDECEDGGSVSDHVVHRAKKKSKKRNKSKKKRKSKEKERVTTTTVTKIPLPADEEEEEERGEEFEEIESDESLLDLDDPPVAEETSRLTDSPASSGNSTCSAGRKAKRLRLVIGNEPCTIIDLPPTAFEGPLAFR